MVQSITKMIDDQRKLLPDIDDATLKGKMSQTFTDVLAATGRLAGHVRSQNEGKSTVYDINKLGIIPKSLYQIIHDELKAILQNMIIQIQIIGTNEEYFSNMTTDQVNVRILMVSAKKVYKKVVTFYSFVYRI